MSVTDYLTKRQRLRILESQLRSARNSFKSHWGELGQYIKPRRTRFFVEDVNKGDKRNADIVDSTATMAVGTLASGMMTGITSPARAWFKLSTGDRGLDNSPEVKFYLQEVERVIRATFLKSNLYNVLPVGFGDIGTFGTSAIFQEEDAESVVNFTSMPIGSYMIAVDKKGRVNTFYREYQMSVRNLIDKFSGRTAAKDIKWELFSNTVKEQFELGNYETMINISHMIQPNEEYDPKKLHSKYKKFSSTYYENGINTSNHSAIDNIEDKFLSEKGYDFFPVLVPRWEVNGEDSYATNCPGMTALGDIKQLQFQEIRVAEALDQKIRPSMKGPTALKTSKKSMIPGEVTYLDEDTGSQGFTRLFDVQFDIREMEAKQEQLRNRISRAFYEDLFLMLANTTRRQITAREVEERHEEKLLALGPVLERINQDLLDPLIENTFFIADEQGLMPDPPDILAGREYEIEYISIMAQAQKLAGIGNIERLAGFVAEIANFDPIAVEKINIEDLIEEYADKLGTSPALIKSKDEMEAIKAAAQQAAAQQAQMEQVNQVASAGKQLSETNMNEDSALQAVLEGDLE